MNRNLRAGLYLAITFGISWTVLIVAWLNGARDIGSAAVASQLFTLGPPIAALTCAFLFEKGERLAALGLRLRPDRWWLASLHLGFLLVGYSQTVGAIFPVAAFDQSVDIPANLALLLDIPASQVPTGTGSLVLIFCAFVAGFAIMFTLTEEMGWRGYLYWQWRSLGFWRFSLLQGAIWGIWHWPMVILFGMIFADNRLIALVFYPLNLMALSPLMTLLRDRGGSIWAPGILHGTLNAISIIIFGALASKAEPSLWILPVNFSFLVLVECFRRKWPDPINRQPVLN